MKINGFGKDFGISRPQGGLRNDQNKETNAKSTTSKPQEKTDAYSISPEARAKMEEVAKQQQKVGEKPEEPQQGKGKLNNHVSELRSASEDGLFLTEEQISAYSSGVEDLDIIADIQAQMAEFETKQAIIKEEEAAAREAARVASNREVLLEIFSKGLGNTKEAMLELMGKDNIMEALGEEEFIRIYGSTELTGIYQSAQERYLEWMDKYQINDSLLDTLLENDH